MMTYFQLLCAALVSFVYVKAIPETTHLIQTDKDGLSIQLDVTFDPEEETVLVVVGDVSQYPGSIPSVNFHDYKTGYGVLKIVNKKVCLLARALVPMASPEKYRLGSTNEIHEHNLRFAPDKLSNRDVEMIAGPRIATFCKDYATYFTVATEVSDNVKYKREAEAERRTVWCVFSKCSGSRAELDSLSSSTESREYLDIK